MLERYRVVRQKTEELCAPLSIEDYVIQSQLEASPPKWHLAHTTWFFETFVLSHFQRNYKALNDSYNFIFNSYYETVGPFLKRSQRGVLSRPTVEEIYVYRRHVDRAMEDLLSSGDVSEEIGTRVELGLNHEEQHQELLLMDIKLNFHNNPLRPEYKKSKDSKEKLQPYLAMQWIAVDEGIHHVGSKGDSFRFDNESPRHRVFLNRHKLASRLVTNGEYMEFINDRGYERPELWLSDGWATIQKNNWAAPLYWVKDGKDWWEMTLHGMQRLEMNQPVSHVSYYEADSFARWKNKRLPTEFELEHAAQFLPVKGNFLEDMKLGPEPSPVKEGLSQVYGDLWEWTQSSYSPYPGYAPLEGALGEYNGKFMANQMVLRGGSYGTPRRHLRATYRNFYPPDARWHFAGIRLAENIL